MLLRIAPTASTYQPYGQLALQRFSSPAPVSAYQMDTLTLPLKPTPDPGDIPPPEPSGSFWNRGEVRLGLLLAGSATVGGGAGYFISKAAGSSSLAMGTAIGATVGAALPVAMLIWALKNWN
ncbi:hypothetical protein COW36_14310 [bacterium (Candidatus Blackallbacteria) CG17_big_fil_post_rev_8_21_14_2_50_48_46]|uniref:Uncharacterized protein n=1 Tax=bacterium (Candidatus Blackallbacteria) CG17_big_fil_post_rev_8_21_14_2_50_48_46 TaxID=2014261 RepID=A0A2M7G2T4_9BACT|nr:MAG: hypothetical protein COW64_08835 [bacterium (Candidatus Blackallbacteria) CG18_big_fil_WC_8_21_14_2_50_49_26]PIW16134.1 MAG: hypothetical protein COW36_14310 [bacterium (Candidatus Blackallbacteria) CG17_big_fil_post_rev_8_21_14_2_50_48_46]PIW44221.1 MAG: hypothetical protein COW20_24640 [bacterium (Candidatus Blackallbacteria) CG13_big_fil_rev_8_21_14_2_50_49_14]